MTELDALEYTLEQARAALGPSFADDAHLRRALGLPPAGSSPTGVETLGAEQATSLTAPADRAAAPRAALTDLRAWRSLRASGSAGLLAGVMLAGVGFGAGFWFGRDGVSAERSLAERPDAIEDRAPARGSMAAVSTEPRAAADAQQSGAEVGSQREHPASAEDPHAVPEPTALRAELASPRTAPPRAKPSPRRDARAPSRAHATAPSAASEELALLRRVERALRAQNPALALALVAELDQRFPDTRLGEEREAARVIASCGVGEGGARFRAERFARERGGSVYAERVREACAIPEKTTSGEGSSTPGDE